MHVYVTRSNQIIWLWPMPYIILNYLNISFMGISQSLPTTGYIKMIDIWMIFTMSCPFLVITFHACLEVVSHMFNIEKWQFCFTFKILKEKKKTYLAKKININAGQLQQLLCQINNFITLFSSHTSKRKWMEWSNESVQ